MDDPTTIELLIKELYSSNYPSQQQATQTLIQIGEPAIQPLLVELKRNDRNESMIDFENRTAQRILIQIGTPALKALIDALNPASTNSHLGRAAVKALVSFGDPRVIQPLIECMLNEKCTGRLYAIDALGYFKYPSAFEPLLLMLQNDNLLVVAHVARALGEYRDPRALEALETILQQRTGETRWMDWRETVLEAIKTISNSNYTPMDRGFFINNRYY